MNIKFALPLFITLSLFVQLPLQGETIILGADDNWKGTTLNNLKTSPGKGGFLDLRLSRSELGTGEKTDILLSLNRPQGYDGNGRYEISEQPEYSDRYFKSGNGSATFNRENRLVLKARDNSALFAPFSNWEDFTIEFWLYPANPKEGESIFQWKGLGRKDDEIYSQSIDCRFINRKLVWSFNNVFQLPDYPESFYEIVGDAVLPRQWNHHMLRYDSRTGMLEYLINGQPAAIIYTTESGDESNTVHTPRIGEEPGDIILGDGFTGFMDEFRMERRFNENRATLHYEKPGYGISPVIDLKYSDSRLDALSIVADTPENAAVFPYFYMTNSILDAEEARQGFQGESSILDKEESWRSYDDTAFAKGRYLVLAFLLYPDMKSDISPGLSFLNIEYTPAHPPLPPSFLRTEKSESGLRLEWNPSASPDVEGYLVFFGEKPGEYIYPGSPLKIENENYTLIQGLSPFKQYFFAVKSYSGKEVRRYSDFSEEISVRP